ncbi:LPXTG cell wall anchor domain-containing protein [Candidatus Falkowbacteria bacterium]|nr:LPXTG cell wall anchor domain-containing protein [Candidatus Falkowbacteria bacterium]
MPNFKKISKNIQGLAIANRQKTHSVDWININSPGKPEIEYLRKKYNFKLSQLAASSAKSNSQRPIIVHELDYIFIILHFPVMVNSSGDKKEANGRIVAAEIEFFIGHGFLISLPSAPIGPLNDFFNLCKKDTGSLLSYEFGSSAILLYEILDKLLKYSYALLDNNSIAISQAEKIVLNEDQKKSAALILNLRHNLINTRKIMQNHKNIIKQLMVMESSIITREHLKKYYGELLNQTKNIWETLENQREMVEVLHDSYESISNYHLGNVMKILTIFYVTFSSLALIAAIFSIKADGGMPFINYENSFWIILGIMGLVGLAMLLLFKKKKWL